MGLHIMCMEWSAGLDAKLACLASIPTPRVENGPSEPEGTHPQPHTTSGHARID